MSVVGGTVLEVYEKLKKTPPLFRILLTFEFLAG